MTATEHPVALGHVVATPVRGDEDAYRLGSGHKTLPYDLPCYLRVSRHLDAGDETEQPRRPPGLLGWTLGVEVIGFEEEIRVKIVHGGVVQVLVGDHEVALLERSPRSC